MKLTAGEFPSTTSGIILLFDGFVKAKMRGRGGRGCKVFA
jgi:hypothetical protein